MLGFAAPGQPLDRSLAPGTAIDAELVFFPGAYPLRALVKQRHERHSRWTTCPYRDNTRSDDRYPGLRGGAHARVPGSQRFPMPLQAIIPARTSTGWAVLAPITERCRWRLRFDTWRLMARAVASRLDCLASGPATCCCL